MQQNKRQLKRTMKNCFLFIPRLLKLTSRLLRDPRVSKADKAILAATIIYTLTPIDLLADFIPFFGLVDDSFLMALALTRLLYRAGEAPLREYWGGEGDIVVLIDTMRQVSELFLPRRIHQRLLGKVQSRSAG